MHLSDLEPDSQTTSPFASMDARVKIVCAVVVIVGAIAVPQYKPVWLFGIAGLLIALTLPSKVTLRYIAVRLLIAGPLIVVIAASLPFLHGAGTPLFTVPGLGWTATAEGLRTAISIAGKSLLCIWIAVLLAGTTDFTHLLDGLSQLRAPSLVVILMAMIYRYLFVIGDETLRTLRARKSRGQPTSRGHSLKVAVAMAGSLMLRCFERSERIANAMVARGFDGTLPVIHQHHRVRWQDLAGGLAVCLTAICITAVSRLR